MARILVKAVVERVVDEAEGVRSYVLAHAKGRELPPFEAGAHLDVHLPSGDKRQYSLASDPSDRLRYRIAVLREPAGRGGSRWIHENLAEGDTITIGSPRNTFRLAEGALRHVLIAGGIGVTPFMSMIEEIRWTNGRFDLHYCARSSDTAAFVGELSLPRESGSVQFHFDGGDPARGCDVRQLLSAPDRGDHVYCCGPKGLIKAVERATSHWPPGSVHFERFAGETADLSEDRPFTIALARTGLSLEVKAAESALTVLNSAGLGIEVGCESGACGSCITPFVGGQAIHRDVCLTDAERIDRFTPCVSRASGTLTIDR